MDYLSFEAGGIGRYALLKDAYYGTGGFSSGNYLIKHARETDDSYKERCNNAYYLNYFAPIINALVDPIFKRRPLRNYAGAGENIVSAFSADVDRTGNDIHSFMKQAALHAKIYGVVFIVMDSRADAGRGGTLADMIENREYPYIYCLDPEYVDSYGVNQAGRITYLKFHEVSSIKDGDVKYREVEFDESGWKVTDEESGVRTGTYDLGCVPVVPLFSRLLESKTILPAPEMLPVAKTARALYNHCSWLAEILKNETFPILTIASLDQQDLVIGSNNALGYDPNAGHAPAFIAPPSDPATVIQNERKNLIQEMYRMASLSFMTGTSEKQSGLSRQWEFERTNQQLSNFAGQISKAETDIMRLFSRWIGVDFEYTVSYPDNFGIVDVAGEIAQAQAVLDLNLSDGLREEVLKKVMTAYLPNLTDDKFDEIIKDYEAAEKDEIYREKDDGV